MKNILAVLAILFVACASIHAQTGVAGSWRVEGIGPGFPWTAVLKGDGSNLEGTVTGCGAPIVAISEGTVKGNIVTFKCKSPDGRVITFTGTVSGAEMALTWALQGPPLPDNNGMFGPAALPQFIAKRLNVITWSGTIQNVNKAGILNPVKNPASIEIKEIADPHWMWRDAGNLTLATFVTPGASFDLSSLALTEQTLSYSFNFTQADEPKAKDERVQCILTRRADDAHEGDCSGGGFLRHVTLNPPAAPVEPKK